MKIFFCDHAGPLVWESREGYPFCNDDWALAYRAGEALRIIQGDCGFSIIAIVASHSGVARAMYTYDAMLERHHCLDTLLHDDYGVAISGTGFCPHMPDKGCKCRKPATGMFDQIVSQLISSRMIKSQSDIDLADCVLVGDKPIDIGFAQNCGIGHKILMSSRYWQPGVTTEFMPDHVVGSLLEAAYLLRNGKALGQIYD